MTERSPEAFVRAAQIRLALAASMYDRARLLPYSDQYVEMGNVAMLIWSAGVDMITAHMLWIGETNLGTSARRRRHLMYRVAPTNRPMRLQAGWSGLSGLHNFQHNYSLSEIQFTANCHDSVLVFAGVNSLLPAPLRLSPDAYAWLAEVG